MDPGSLQQYIRRRIGFFVCCFLTLGILLLAVFKDKGWLDVRARAKHLKGIESQVSDIEVENQRLMVEIQALRTDPAAIEKIAREQLKLVKPGEVVIILPEEKPADQK
jgi:cell division protein FtsB